MTRCVHKGLFEIPVTAIYSPFMTRNSLNSSTAMTVYKPLGTSQGITCVYNKNMTIGHGMSLIVNPSNVFHSVTQFGLDRWTDRVKLQMIHHVTLFA